MRFHEMHVRGNGSGTIYVYTIVEIRSGTAPLGTVVFTLKLGTVLERSERFLKGDALAKNLF